MKDEIMDMLTIKGRADKAISSLKGILEGIKIDNIVTDQEIRELLLWADEHRQVINKKPFNEFMQIILETNFEESSRNEIIQDLIWLTQKYESDNYYYNGLTTNLQELQGICHGILADGKIEDKELFKFNEWLQNNEHLSTYFPYDELRSLVLSIVSDKIIEEDEKNILKAFIDQFVSIKDSKTKTLIADDIKNIQITGLCTSDPQVEFKNKTFCITGVLSSKSRKELQNDILNLKGKPVNSVTRETDFLIVGDNGNPAWAFSCYGRKVEKALDLRKEGHTITLIHEFDFIDAIEDAKI